MAKLKITKQTDLRDNIYKTLEEVATSGRSRPILSRHEYDEMWIEKELMKEFQEPLKFDDLTELKTVLSRLDKKFSFKK